MYGFNLNTDLIQKMGWIKGPTPFGFSVERIFQDDREVKFYIDIPSESKVFVIKNKKDFIIFIRCEYGNKIQFFTTPIKTNIDLFRIIKNELSCNDQYKRFFQLSKILNEKTS